MSGPPQYDVPMSADGADLVSARRRRLTDPYSWADWWRQPLSPLACVLGWAGASVVFAMFLWLLGGPSYPDYQESLYSTMLIAHGHFGCLFPGPHTVLPVIVAPDTSSTGPLYPLLTGVLAWATRIGHGVAFPVAATRATHCVGAFVALRAWVWHAHAVWPTLMLGYLAWLPLMAGAIAVVRVAGLGRRGSEPTILLGVALLLPVSACLGFVFHPEYLLATGLALVAVAAVARGRWGVGGAVMALAVLAQPLAALVGAAVLGVAVSRRAWSFVAGAAVASLAVMVPLAVMTDGRAIADSLFASSRVSPLSASPARSTGGTVLWELHLRGAPLFVIARVAPVLASLALGWWVARRRGGRIDAADWVALGALALMTRLVFEQNLFGYYFAPPMVALVLAEAARHRLRGDVVAWVAVVSIAFSTIPSHFAARMEPWGRFAASAETIAVAGGLAVAVAIEWRRRHVRWTHALALAGVLVVFHSQVFFANQFLTTLPHWLWQVILVPTGVYLAVTAIGGRDPGSEPPTRDLGPQGALASP